MYWEEKEAKFDLACLSHPEAYIFFIEQQQYNWSKLFDPRCVYFSTVEVCIAREGLLVVISSCFTFWKTEINSVTWLKIKSANIWELKFF